MAAVTTQPGRDIAADVLPPSTLGDVAVARRRAANAAEHEPWEHEFFVIGNWLKRRKGRQWAWYVAIPFGDGHRLPGAVPVPGSFLEFAGRAWTEEGARQAIKRATRRAVIDAPTLRPASWHRRAQVALIMLSLSSICLGSAFTVIAIAGQVAWTWPLGLFAVGVLALSAAEIHDRIMTRRRAHPQ